ncbi:unnamed protein product [Paramecium pentaurelia]|uniref:Uncharacterized protein n=1 Tax=Paramecium pentaurelia TaxID=43138 RepID=A0A8S1TKD4_9CILI|nr:unnamed protein product [Paramecium pentaurelia]
MLLLSLNLFKLEKVLHKKEKNKFNILLISVKQNHQAMISVFDHEQSGLRIQSTLDCIMNLTRSMRPCQQNMKKTIAKIIDQFQNSINQYQIGVAFVGYREIHLRAIDFCTLDDEKHRKNQYRITRKQLMGITCYLLKFYKKIWKLIQKVKIKGDQAEDVVSAFEQTFKTQFFLLIMTAYYEYFHLLMLFAMEGTIIKLNLMTRLINMPKIILKMFWKNFNESKQNNFLYSIKINNRTDIMFEKMKAIIQLQIITTEQKSQNFVDVIGFTLRMFKTESKRLKS